MRIIVCIKQVIDTSIPLDLDLESGRLDREDFVYILNPYDRVAVELSLRIREDAGGEVIVISMGPPRVDRALRSCLAMGADEAIRIWDHAFEGSDGFVTAQVLSEVVQALKYDLILCGKQSLDNGSGQVGAGIAGLLNLPQVSAVAGWKLLAGGKALLVHRALEKGDRESIECRLPALFTVERELCEPRYSSFPSSLRALKMEIPVWGRGELSLNEKRVGERGAMVRSGELSLPRPRPKKIFTPDSNLPPHERMKLIMSGGVAKKKEGSLIVDSPEEAALQLIALLTRQDFLGEDGEIRGDKKNKKQERRRP